MTFLQSDCEVKQLKSLENFSTLVKSNFFFFWKIWYVKLSKLSSVWFEKSVRVDQLCLQILGNIFASFDLQLEQKILYCKICVHPTAEL